jgi:hypothetical protein
MSRTGVLVKFSHRGASEVLPKVGEIAFLEIDLPSSQSISPRFLDCVGVVVRISEVEADHLEVAFELRRLRVDERHKKASSDTGPALQTPAEPGPVL